MIEVTSRRMECTLLTPDFSQVPAVALHYFAINGIVATSATFNYKPQVETRQQHLAFCVEHHLNMINKT